MNKIETKENIEEKPEKNNNFDEYKNMFLILFAPIFASFLFYQCHLADIKYTSLFDIKYTSLFDINFFSIKDLFTINGGIFSSLKILTIMFLSSSFSISINLLFKNEYKNRFYNWFHLKLIKIRNVKISKDTSSFISFCSFSFYLSLFFLSFISLIMQSYLVSAYDYNLIPNEKINFLPFLSFYIWSGIVINLFINIKFEIQKEKEISVAILSSIFSLILTYHITDLNSFFTSFAIENNNHTFQYSSIEYILFAVAFFVFFYLLIMSSLKPIANFLNSLDEKTSKENKTEKSFFGINFKIEPEKEKKPLIVIYRTSSFFSVIPFGIILFIALLTPFYLVTANQEIDRTANINGETIYYKNSVFTHTSNTETVEEHIEIYLGKSLPNEDSILSLYSISVKENRVDEYINLLTYLIINNQEMKIKNKDWIKKAEYSKYDNFSTLFLIKINKTLMESVDNEKTIQVLKMINKKEYNKAYDFYTINLKENIEDGEKTLAIYFLEYLFLFLDDNDKIRLDKDNVIQSKYESLQNIEKNKNESTIEDLNKLQKIFQL